MEKYAIAYVHLPSGEVGRSEFIFTTSEGAQGVCDDLNSVSKTVMHFVLAENENLRIVANNKREEYGRTHK